LGYTSATAIQMIPGRFALLGRGWGRSETSEQ